VSGYVRHVQPANSSKPGVPQVLVNLDMLNLMLGVTHQTLLGLSGQRWESWVLRLEPSEQHSAL
jgi:hypothetical protein